MSVRNCKDVYGTALVSEGNLTSSDPFGIVSTRRTVQELVCGGRDCMYNVYDKSMMRTDRSHKEANFALVQFVSLKISILVQFKYYAGNCSTVPIEYSTGQSIS